MRLAVNIYTFQSTSAAMSAPNVMPSIPVGTVRTAERGWHAAWVAHEPHIQSPRHLSWTSPYSLTCIQVATIISRDQLVDALYVLYLRYIILLTGH